MKIIRFQQAHSDDYVYVNAEAISDFYQNHKDPGVVIRFIGGDCVCVIDKIEDIAVWLRNLR